IIEQKINEWLLESEDGERHEAQGMARFGFLSSRDRRRQPLSASRIDEEASFPLFPHFDSLRRLKQLLICHLNLFFGKPECIRTKWRIAPSRRRPTPPSRSL